MACTGGVESPGPEGGGVLYTTPVRAIVCPDPCLEPGGGSENPQGGGGVYLPGPDTLSERNIHTMGTWSFSKMSFSRYEKS